jgi:hypothetical protein
MQDAACDHKCDLKAEHDTISTSVAGGRRTDRLAGGLRRAQSIVPVMKELRSEVEIHASAERVWHILTDFASFAQWNPFIRRVSGEATAGQRLEVHIQPAGARGMMLHPTVVKTEPNGELRWLEPRRLPGLFDGEHIFTIEPLGENRVRFTQSEIFTGVLVPLRASP